MKGKKLLVLALALIMMISLFSACSKAEETPETTKESVEESTDAPETTEEDAQEMEEPVIVKYVGPGTKPLDEDAVLAALNEKMLADGVNVQLEIEWIGWDVVDQKVNMKMSTNESFDLLHVWSDPTKINFLSMGALTVLNDLLEEYGQNIMKATPEQCWIPETYKGDIIAVPAYWRDISDYGGPSGELYVQTNKTEPLGLETPQTIDELIPFMKELQAGWGGEETVYAWEHNVRRTATWLHRTYDSWPFYTETENPLIYISKDGEVKSWFETEEFKMDCEYFEQLYKEGLIHPDVLSVPADTRQNMANAGKILLGMGTCGEEAIAGLKKTVDENIWIEKFLLNPEKPYVQFELTWNRNVVPAASEHPEAAIMFLDWLYSSDENHDLLMYGIEGQDYTVADNNRIERAYNDDNQMLYNFPEWQMANFALRNFQPADPDSFVEAATTVNPNSEIHIASGFIFDSTPVKTEYANVVAEMPASIYPMKFGLVSYEDYIDNALETLKAAGLDVIVEEYERQFNEWLASK